MAEGIEHKGHTIMLLKREGGWRVYIRPPDAPMLRAEFAASLSRDEVIGEATRLIDEVAAAPRSPRRQR